MSTDRLSLIHNAIDEKAFDRKYASHESEMRKKFGVPKERLVIGAVGRLSPEKAFDNLITATHRLVGEGHDIELWIAGEGDIQDELQKQIDELKLNDRVRLLGFCDDTIALYHAMDVFVLSSLREGLPNVVLEAASMRVPMVSTRVAGVPKMVTDGKEGLLCECGDVDGLTDAMRRVVSDKELRGNLATEGRALIEREYSFQNRMTKIKAIYDQVLGYNEQARKRPA
jgi:glycosyltransferase involved in cell wall biosynthesis